MSSCLLGLYRVFPVCPSVSVPVLVVPCYLFVSPIIKDFACIVPRSFPLLHSVPTNDKQEGINYLDLTDREIQESHTIADLNGRLGSNAAHGGSETSVKLQDSEFVEVGARLDLGNAIIGDDLVLWGRLDLVPVDLCTLALLGQEAVEQQEKVAHLILEQLLDVEVWFSKRDRVD